MSTFNPPADIAQITLAKSSDVNAVKAATGIAFGLLPNETKLQRGTVNFSVDTGTANSYVVTLDASITTYTDGLQVVFRPLNSNTDISTINLNGIGVRSIRLTDSNPIQAGDISAGAIIDVRYSTATGFFHLTPNSAIYAHDAGVSADAAAASASAASSSASSAATSASAASSSASSAATSASNASTSASTATTQATNASTSATTATTQAGIATTQATNASTSATNAATSATTATTQAGIATTQATNAATSATSAAAAYDSFDDRYLGSKASDPTLDNDGNALLTGALYWNSATSVFKVWSGSAWITNLTSNQFGTNVATFLQTPSSANLAAALTDETGTAGKVVFDTNPIFPAQVTLSSTAESTLVVAGGLQLGGNTASNVSKITSAINWNFSPFSIVRAAANTATPRLFGLMLGGDSDSSTSIGDYNAIWGIYDSSPTSTSTSVALNGKMAYAAYAGHQWYVNNSLKMLVNSSGNFGIGGSASTTVSALIGKNITGGTVAYGSWVSAQVMTDVTNVAFGTASNLSLQTGSTLGELVHYYANQSTVAGSTLSTQKGYSVESTLTGATNNYGFYGGINASAGTTRYNLYMAGTADNYLAGSLGIGTTGLTGSVLLMGKAITGGTYAFNAQCTASIQSDVTGGAYIYSSQPSTQALAFTLSNLAHFQANQGTVGAGSTVTNQYGFYCNALTGATNNYGFYGGIASGTGRYNLYMAGSADNYMAGSLGIGAVPTSKLHARSDANALTVIGQIQNRTSGANVGASIAFITSTNDISDNRYAYIGAVTSGAGENGNTLVFAPNSNGGTPTEAMRINDSGNVGIGTTADASAILDAQSTTKGVRFPNMTTTQKLAIATPAAGLVVFDTTLSKLCVYTGAAWQTITSA